MANVATGRFFNAPPDLEQEAEPNATREQNALMLEAEGFGIGVLSASRRRSAVSMGRSAAWLWALPGPSPHIIRPSWTDEGQTLGLRVRRNSYVVDLGTTLGVGSVVNERILGHKGLIWKSRF